MIETLGTVAAAVIATTAVAYKWLQHVKEGTEKESLHRSTLDVMSAYKEQALEARRVTEVLQGRLAAVEAERNAFATEVGQLRASVQYMGQEIAELTESCKRLEEENSTLQETLSGLLQTQVRILKLLEASEDVQY